MTDPRSRRAAATATVAALLTVLVAPLAGAAPAPATVPAVPAAHGCTRTLAIADRVLTHQLHSDPTGWSTVGHARAYGMTIPVGRNGSRVEVSTEAPCRMVPSIVRHEWMHQRQMRWFGWSALSQRPDIEIMADCGSWMLGSRYTPYIDRARAGGDACTTSEFAYARAMIDAAGVAIVRDPGRA